MFIVRSIEVSNIYFFIRNQILMHANKAGIRVACCSYGSQVWKQANDGSKTHIKNYQGHKLSKGEMVSCYSKGITTIYFFFAY